MRDRAVLAACAALAVGLGLVVAPDASGAPTTAPAGVTNLAPFQDRATVSLRWANPRRIDRDLVRIARGPAAPATPQDGRAIALGSPRATAATLRGLAAGRQYSVSVWTQRGEVLSHRTTTSFTTHHTGVSPSSALGGEVVDSAGDPLRNATVYAFDYANFLSRTHTRTDSSGHFRLLVAGGHYEVAVIGSRALGGTSDRTGYLFALRRVTSGRGTSTTVSTSRSPVQPRSPAPSPTVTATRWPGCRCSRASHRPISTPTSGS